MYLSDTRISKQGNYCCNNSLNGVGTEKTGIYT